MEEVPLKLAMVEITIEAVRDVMFYGSRISVEPQYEKTYDKKAAAKLDNQVMTALRKHVGKKQPENTVDKIRRFR